MIVLDSADAVIEVKLDPTPSTPSDEKSQCPC